ncbi:MAG: peptidase S24 [Gammaproteobacteria bacterium CG11_big_fil_rev_8_21_14_0_20_46_22]|nr:MAG: peptidase S24 [Gammaproteobacteria bacterium CG11_big_fil_rev_8_21_14_0_20_46_22]
MEAAIQAIESEENNSRQHLAENLKLLMKSRKLSLNQLAQDLNIPVMTIRRLISGQTEDPRVYTLKLFADYFHVSVDSLITPNRQVLQESLEKTKPYFIPVIDWHTAKTIHSLDDLNLTQWKNWQPVTLSSDEEISEQAFALESRPSMYPRFPQGTVFIIDPKVKPADGDTVLVKLKESGELTLRYLSIDPPEWKLSPLVADSTILDYDKQHHEIVGINVLTMLYNRKNHG